MLTRIWMTGLLLVGVGCHRAPAERPPDILLVVLDTVRADRMSAYGYERPTSLQLAALAESGVRFSDVTVSGTWTWPGHGELFTGLPPWENGAHHKLDHPPGKPPINRLSDNIPTLAEHFSAAGYRSLAFASNGWLSEDLGLTRGFDRVSVSHGQDGLTVRGAVDAMREGDDRPLFLFVNLLQAHSPLMEVPGVPWSAQHSATLRQAPSWLSPLVEVQGEGYGVDLSAEIDRVPIEVLASEGRLHLPAEGRALIGDLYDGGLVALDHALQELVSGWIATGRSMEVLVVTSDHGELLGEHGLLQHGGTCYPELLSVPLVISAPGRLPADRTVGTPVQTRDIAPTLLDLAGLQPGAAGSLLPVIDGQQRPGPIMARAWPFKAASSGPLSTGWRYYREHPMAVLVPDQGPPALYDVSVDPDLQADLAAAMPGLAARLADAARREIGDGPDNPFMDTMSDELRANLEALGYVAETAP